MPHAHARGPKRPKSDRKAVQLKSAKKWEILQIHHPKRVSDLFPDSVLRGMRANLGNSNNQNEQKVQKESADGAIKPGIHHGYHFWSALSVRAFYFG